MARGNFTITEFLQTGSIKSDAIDGARFEWTADNTAPSPLGGARATPDKGWPIGTSVDLVKTKYPGAKQPSIQVLTVDMTEFTLHGTWWDKWNFPGYAVQEMHRFEEMVKRANPVRVQYQQEAIEGIIKVFVPDYRWEGQISYSFTLEPLGRPDDANATGRSPKTVEALDSQFADSVALSQALFENHGRVPAHAMQGTRATSVESSLKQMSTRIDSLGATLDTRNGKLKPIGEFKRIATQFRLVGSSCTEVISKTIDARADTELGIKTALDTLNFESWSRSIRFQSRILLGQSRRAAKSTEDRGEPPIERMHRTKKGESLYTISIKYYGDPSGAGLIAERNHLRVLSLDGGETLIIPQRGQR